MLLEHWIIIFKNYRMYTYTFCIFISRHISIFKEFEHYYSIRNKGKCDCKINIILLTSFRLYTVSFMYNATSDIYSILYDEFYSYRINLTLILYEWCIVRDSCAPSEPLSMMVIYLNYGPPPFPTRISQRWKCSFSSWGFARDFLIQWRRLNQRPGSKQTALSTNINNINWLKRPIIWPDWFIVTSPYKRIR